MGKIDKDALIAEIKRLQDINNRDADNGCDEDQCCGYDYCLEDILRYINSRPEEPVNKDLEKEIKRWFGEKYMGNMIGLPTLPIVQIIAHHFAEWQKEQMINVVMEGTVDNTAYPTKINFHTYFSELCTNDKVKVIIIKKD